MYRVTGTRVIECLVLCSSLETTDEVTTRYSVLLYSYTNHNIYQQRDGEMIFLRMYGVDYIRVT